MINGLYNQLGNMQSMNQYDEYYRQMIQSSAAQQQDIQQCFTTSNSTGSISIANPNSISVPSTVPKRIEKKIDKRLLLL